jgi:cell division protein FtsQ
MAHKGGVVEVDRRMAARRRQVAEVQARSSLARLMWILVLALTAALTVWLFRSPLLAVSSISVSGFEAAEIESILRSNGVVIGRPMVTVKPAGVTEALLADPRIKDASVELKWPQSVVVGIEPRRAVAWANLGGHWGQVGVDGVVMATAPEPSDGLPILEVPWDGSDPSPEALGGLEFLAALDVLVAQQTVVISRGDELWAMLPNVTIRLGRPIDMSAKAMALEAVLAQGVEIGSVVNLLAPARPAVMTPGAAAAAATTTTEAGTEVTVAPPDQ